MSDHECGSNPELTCIHERCNCVRRQNIVNKCHENCVGKQACVQLIRNAEAKAAEKAKADKLALLHEVAEEYYKHGKSAEEWVTLREVLNILKQRIEAE